MREACRSCFRVDAVGANVGDGVAAEDVETGVGCSSACRVRSWLVVKTQIVRGRTYRTSRYESRTLRAGAGRLQSGLFRPLRPALEGRRLNISSCSRLILQVVLWSSVEPQSIGPDLPVFPSHQTGG